MPSQASAANADDVADFLPHIFSSGITFAGHSGGCVVSVCLLWPRIQFICCIENRSSVHQLVLLERTCGVCVPASADAACLRADSDTGVNRGSPRFACEMSAAIELVDIGVNLLHRSFGGAGGEGRHATLLRAVGAGVRQVVVTGTSLRASEQAVAYARQHATAEEFNKDGCDVYATAGVHPHDSKSWNAGTLDALRSLAAQERVVAIGECGLDYNADRMFSSKEQQRVAFEAQLGLAIELGMPLFIHEREAHADFVATVDRVVSASAAPLPPLVVHCFTGTPEEAHVYLERGWYLGLTGYICKAERGKVTRGAIASIPRDRLMLETDAPFMSPDRRTRLCEPHHCLNVAQTVAEAWGCDVAEVAAATTANARRFFGLAHAAPELTPELAAAAAAAYAASQDKVSKKGGGKGGRKPQQAAPNGAPPEAAGGAGGAAAAAAGDGAAQTASSTSSSRRRRRNRGGRGGKKQGDATAPIGSAEYAAHTRGQTAAAPPPSSAPPPRVPPAAARASGGAGDARGSAAGSSGTTAASAVGAYVDTHCHVDSIMERLRTSDVDALTTEWGDACEGVVAQFCDPPAFSPSLATYPLLLSHPKIWAAFGCHPHHAKYYTDALEGRMVEALEHERAVALGECGLDYDRDRSPRDVQRDVFERQLKLAVTLNKPVVIHIRDAEDDALRIMTANLPSEWRIHVHCFTGTSRDAERFLEAFPSNLFFGITGSITKGFAEKTREAVKHVIPLDKLLLETDGPWMMPESAGAAGRREGGKGRGGGAGKSRGRGRGGVCTPAHVPLIADAIAELKGIAAADLYRSARAATKRMYGI